MALKYQIALTHVIFDNTYRNVLRFDTRAEQEAYFNANTLFANAPMCNFAVGSLYATNVVVDYKDTPGNINELLNQNYCIVKDNNPNAVIKYYYYFVTAAQQDNYNRIVCSLELDVYQTYYIDLEFNDCTILRAHLNRFLDNGDGTVSFDASETSKLFEREPMQDLPKRLIWRERIKLRETNGLPPSTDTYYDENVMCWLYLYLDPNHEFTFYTPNGTPKTIKPPRVTIYGGDIPTNIGCLAIPIYKTYGRPNAIQPIEIVDSNPNSGYSWTMGLSTFMSNFEKLNNGYEFVYSVKLSLMPPGNMDGIKSAPAGQVGEITADFGDGTQFPKAPAGLGDGVLVAVASNYNAAILLNSQTIVNLQYVDFEIPTYAGLTFTKNQLMGAANPDFNPKLYNNDYLELNLTDSAGNSFTYDLQKLNTTTLKLLVTEPLTPDYTKTYARLIPPTSNTQYTRDTTKNLLGLVTDNDNTVLLPTTAYQTMIANNKNFYQQREYNRRVDLVKAAGNVANNGLSAITSGNFIGGVSNMLSTGMNATLDYSTSVKNQQYEIDNLRNAPGSIEAASGNFIFNSLYTDAGYYIEQYSITENSRKAVNDYMMLYGFNYNRIDNIKNVDNIRKYYNYVQAYVEEIKTGLVNISNTVHNKIREIFARGVRMWNLREFTYARENYERWLEQ